jgi:phosphoglycolate phosphatase
MATVQTFQGVTVVFDLDGTLVDTAPDLHRAFSAVMMANGLQPLPLNEMRSLVGHGAAAMIERGFERAGLSLHEGKLDQLVDEFIIHYRDGIAQASNPFPSALVAIERLHTAGAILAVCTNKRTSLAIDVLTELKLDHHFSAIVGPDLVEVRKPDSRHLLETIKRAGGDPRRALMVGDTITDVSAARAANIPCVFMSFGYGHFDEGIEANVRLNDFADLFVAAVRLMGLSTG